MTNHEMLELTAKAAGYRWRLLASECADAIRARGAGMTRVLFVVACLTLAGCGKVKDTFSTGTDGYAMRCIEGTRYILLSSEHGMAITPHVGTNGLPKSC